MKTQKLLNPEHENAQLTTGERIQMWGIVALMLLAIGACLFTAWKGAEFVRSTVEVPTQQAQAQVASLTPIPQMPDDELNGMFTRFVWFVGICLVIWVGYKIAKSGFGGTIVMILLGLAAVAVIFWILLYRGGDVSTPEARDQNLQVVRVVQPVGDPDTDKTYAEVNRDNSITNAINAGGVSVYMILVWVTIILFAAIGVFFYYLSKR